MPAQKLWTWWAGGIRGTREGEVNRFWNLGDPLLNNCYPHLAFRENYSSMASNGELGWGPGQGAAVEEVREGEGDKSGPGQGPHPTVHLPGVDEQGEEGCEEDSQQD